MSTLIIMTNNGNKSIITEREHNLITNKDTLKAFRRGGGSETAQRSYTCAGYVVTKLISRSPNRQHKTVREFKFYSFPTYQQTNIFKKLFVSMDSEGMFKLKRFKRLLSFDDMITIVKNKVIK